MRDPLMPGRLPCIESTNAVWRLIPRPGIERGWSRDGARSFCRAVAAILGEKWLDPVLQVHRLQQWRWDALVTITDGDHNHRRERCNWFDLFRVNRPCGTAHVYDQFAPLFGGALWRFLHNHRHRQLDVGHPLLAQRSALYRDRRHTTAGVLLAFPLDQAVLVRGVH